MAAIVMGVATVDSVKPLPLKITWLTVTGVVPVLITETGMEFDDPTLVATDTTDGATERVGRGSAMPAHPAVQAIVRARTLESTRTRFSRNAFMSIRSPRDKFRFFLSIRVLGRAKGADITAGPIVVLVLRIAKLCGVQFKDGCALPFGTGTDPVRPSVLRDTRVFRVFLKSDF